MELFYRIAIVILFVVDVVRLSNSQHETIPYEPIRNICQRCLCLTAKDENDGNRLHHILSCSDRKLKHILPRWPEEFGTNHTGVDIIATFSDNSVALLQQIPPTNAALSFSCRHCGIKTIQTPTFVDVPNILRLDLSWNYLNEDILTADVFRGPYNVHAYEPIALEELNLRHNNIRTLDRNIFEHTPHLKRLNLANNWFDVINAATAAAIGSVPKLERLDLSHNELQELPKDFFKSHKNLKELYLQGNNFKMIPPEITILGSSLEFLSIGDNPIKQITEDMSNLKALKYLNISGMIELEDVNYAALTRLNKLNALICSNNPKLKRLDITSLRNAYDLEVLDISNNNLTALLVFVDHLAAITLPQWSKLHRFHIEGNPWNCDCALLKILQEYKTKLSGNFLQARCKNPYHLAGYIIRELNAEKLCPIPAAHKLKISNHDPPLSSKPKSLLLSGIIIATIVVIGLIAGFTIVLVKKRLRKSEFMFITPIRYTIVRNNNFE